MIRSENADIKIAKVYVDFLCNPMEPFISGVRLIRTRRIDEPAYCITKDQHNNWLKAIEYYSDSLKPVRMNSE